MEGIEWTVNQDGTLTNGVHSWKLSGKDIHDIAKMKEIRAIERALEVIVGADVVRRALSVDPFGHDASLYSIQESMLEWRRWKIVADLIPGYVRISADGEEMWPLTNEQVEEVAGAEPVAHVWHVLEAALGPTGRGGFRRALVTDGRPLSVQYEEIRSVAVDWLTAPNVENGDDDALE